MAMEACKYCNDVAHASGSEVKYATALCETISTSDASPSSSDLSRACVGQQSSFYASAVDAEMEASKGHWSELTTELSSNGVEQQQQRQQIADSNREVSRNLAEKLGERFYYQSDVGKDFVLGEKIAEGGQAEIYRAEHRSIFDGQLREAVVKVFKLEGAPLQDLHHQLHPNIESVFYSSHRALIDGVRLLDDRRLALQMKRYWGDLRKVIDLRMQDNRHETPPFTTRKAYHIMWMIAKGMNALRKEGITHRDLKASSVLVQLDPGVKQCPVHSGGFRCFIADYECSVGVVGTGFWRAPEILRACALRDGSIHTKPKLFSESSDVYSYAMTCYEVLWRKAPFENVCRNDYEAIFSGNIKLEWPSYIDLEL